MREEIARFCRKIVEALHQSWLSPEERRQREEAEARQRADEARRQQEVEAERRADEEARQKQRELEAQQRAAAQERTEREIAAAIYGPSPSSETSPLNIP
jgi:hypothetical protein